ncbi:MAG: hypothetical protein E7438_07515 [Ruminococcaceae bacterium]|nr:hypothetical protein [Oscillospiraceae bacterium]
MPLKHYLDHYDDSESASCVPQAKEEKFTPREFAETGYIPMFACREGIMFDACLTIQKEKFIYDIFHRVYDLFGESCPYTKEEFSVEIYEAGEQVKISVISLPTKDLQEGNILKMLYVMDGEHVKLYFLLVRQDAEGQHIYSFDLQSGDWGAEAIAPADTEELLGVVLEILDEKTSQYPHYISARCPICNRAFKLGLTEEEREGYQRYNNDEEDLEDAIPALNAFEREFLITGMCPDCQCDVFRKEPPEDLSRWAME